MLDPLQTVLDIHNRLTASSQIDQWLFERARRDQVRTTGICAPRWIMYQKYRSVDHHESLLTSRLAHRRQQSLSGVTVKATRWVLMIRRWQRLKRA